MLDDTTTEAPTKRKRKPRAVAAAAYSVTYLERVTRVSTVVVMAPNQAEARKLADDLDRPEPHEIGSTEAVTVTRIGE